MAAQRWMKARGSSSLARGHHTDLACKLNAKAIGKVYQASTALVCTLCGMVPDFGGLPRPVEGMQTLELAARFSHVALASPASSDVYALEIGTMTGKVTVWVWVLGFAIDPLSTMGHLQGTP